MEAITSDGTFLAPVNSTRRGVSHPRPPVAYNYCCVNVLPGAVGIAPTTLQLINETYTCRYSGTSATGWVPAAPSF